MLDQCSSFPLLLGLSLAVNKMFCTVQAFCSLHSFPLRSLIPRGKCVVYKEPDKRSQWRVQLKNDEGTADVSWPRRVTSKGQEESIT